MNRTRLWSALALATSMTLAACGGGGGGASPPAKWGSASQASDPAATSTSGQAVASNATGHVVLALSEDNVIKARHYRNGAWSAAEPVSRNDPATVSAINPVIAMDPAGNAIAVWRELHGAWGIYASRYNAATTAWSTPVEIGAGGGDVAGFAVVMDASGNAMAGWREKSGANTVVNAARHDAATASWSAPVRVDTTSTAANNQTPVMGVDSAGTVTLAWQQKDARETIQASRYSAGGWSAPVQVDDPAAVGVARDAALGVGANGDAVAIWTQVIPGGRQVINASRNSNNAWGPAVQVNLAAGNAELPQVVVDATGHATAVWQEHNGTRYAINTSRFGDGTWSAPALIDGAGTVENAVNPAVTVDGAGQVTVVWKQYKFPDWYVSSNRLVAGAWGATPTTLGGPNKNPFNILPPLVAADGTGNVTIGWSEQLNAVAPYKYAVNVVRFE